MDNDGGERRVVAVFNDVKDCRQIQKERGDLCCYRDIFVTCKSHFSASRGLEIRLMGFKQLFLGKVGTDY